MLHINNTCYPIMFSFFAAQFPQISDDLVNSHHLLLCCIDTLYNIVLLSGRNELFNFTSLANGTYVGASSKDHTLQNPTLLRDDECVFMFNGGHILIVFNPVVLPEDFSSDVSSAPPTRTQCILNELCRRHSGLYCTYPPISHDSHVISLYYICWTHPDHVIVKIHTGTV